MSDNVIEQGATGRMRYWLSCKLALKHARTHKHTHILTVVDSSAMQIASSVCGAAQSVFKQVPKMLHTFLRRFK